MFLHAGACGVQKAVLDPLRPELQTVLSQPGDAVIRPRHARGAAHILILFSTVLRLSKVQTYRMDLLFSI